MAKNDQKWPKKSKNEFFQKSLKTSKNTFLMLKNALKRRKSTFGKISESRLWGHLRPFSQQIFHLFAFFQVIESSDVFEVVKYRKFVEFWTFLTGAKNPKHFLQKKFWPKEPFSGGFDHTKNLQIWPTNPLLNCNAPAQVRPSKQLLLNPVLEKR